MITKHKTFAGGYKFNNFSGQPGEELITLKVPGKVVIPLKQGFGDEVSPVVKPGEQVKAGQIIGIDDNSVSSPVHSSVNGKVEKIEKINYFNNEINAITIISDGTDKWQELEGHTSEWKKLSPKKIEEMLYKSGVTSLDRNGIPTRYKSSNIMPGEVEHIIIHGANSEVFNLSLSVLLDEKNISNFIQGLGILKKVFPEAELHLALNKCRKKLMGKIAESITDSDRINFYTVKPKYPQGYDEVLIPTLLDKEFPYGYSATNIGVIVLSIQTVLHIYAAVVEGKPLIEKTLALCGTGFKNNLHINARIGTSIEDIVKNRINEDEEIRYILNSPLTGNKISDLSIPVGRTFNNIIALLENRKREFLAFANPGLKKDAYSRTVLSPLFGFLGLKKPVETNLHGEKRSCLFCSFCEEVCPADIIPHHIYRYIKKDIIDETLINYKIFNCIECNLCSYVCTSKIPVAKYIKEGKEKLIAMGLDVSLYKSSRMENFKGMGKNGVSNSRSGRQINENNKDSTKRAI